MPIKIKQCAPHFKIILLLLVFSALGCLLYWGHNKNDSDNINMMEKVLRFKFEVRNVSNDFVAENHFSFLVPADIARRQKVLDIKSDYKILVRSEGDRVSYAEVDLGVMAPRSIKIVSVDIRVALADGPVRSDADDKKHLAEARYIESESRQVQSIVDLLDVKSPGATFKWTVANIAKESYHREAKGALAAINSRSGDCTEHMFTFMALARALEIPTRGIAGFLAKKNVTLVSGSEYHNWSEYYDGGKWKLADTFYGAFDDLYPNYIVFDILDDAEFKSFVTASDNLEVRL